MKKIILILCAMFCLLTASAQAPYSYKYGKLYREGNVLTKENAAQFLDSDEAGQYKTARNLFVAGSAVTYTGCAVGLVGCGLMTASALSDSLADNTFGLTLSTVVAMFGGAAVLIGAPIMISGAYKAKKIGERQNVRSVQLACGFTRHGVGLTLNF